VQADAGAAADLHRGSWSVRVRTADGAEEDVSVRVAPGEEARPVRIRLERVRVEVVRDVDAQIGEVVLVPGPADVVVLLEDRERDPGLLESGSPRTAAEPRADDPDAKRVELVARRLASHAKRRRSTPPKPHSSRTSGR
jgi:hypothetical protein